MEIVRILHISDLLVSGAESQFATIVEHIIRRARRYNQLTREAFDYIVVCGNITLDGQADSFAAAAKLLKQCADELLVKEAGKKRLNRLLIVPGQHDVEHHDDGTLDFSTFKSFHDQFFRDEIAYKAVDPFDPQQAILRELKDLSLIGVFFWNDPDEQTATWLLNNLNHCINDVVDHSADLNYVNFTPTIIASASTPLLDLKARRQVTYRSLQQALMRQRITLQLLGACEVVCIPREPFGFDHVSLSTGPHDDGFWPFRMNVLEVQGRESDRNVGKKQPIISNWAFQLLSPTAEWEQDPHLAGQLDSFVPQMKPPEPFEPFFEKFLAELEEEINSKGTTLIIVRGFPGAGKRRFFQALERGGTLPASRTDIPSHKDIQIFTWDVPPYPQAQQMLSALHREVEAKRRDDTKACLVLYDRHFINASNEEKSQLQDFLDQHLPTFYTTFKMTAVIYIHSAFDFTLQYSPAGGAVRRLRLPPIDDRSMERLLAHYAYSTPIDETSIHRVTGKYTGFSYLVLDATKACFQTKPGAEPIRRDTGPSLLREALMHENVREESIFFLRCFESVSKGREIRDYIQKKLVQVHQQDVALEWGVGPLVIDVGDLKQGLSLREQDDINISLDRLVELGFLEKQGGSYTLLIVAPFYHMPISFENGQQSATIAASGVAEPATIIVPASTADANTRNKLGNMMLQAFNEDELAHLTLVISTLLEQRGLGQEISIEQIGGNNVQTKIFNLIAFMNRRNLYNVLVEAIRQMRPYAEV